MVAIGSNAARSLRVVERKYSRGDVKPGAAGEDDRWLVFILPCGGFTYRRRILPNHGYTKVARIGQFHCPEVCFRRNPRIAVEGKSVKQVQDVLASCSRLNTRIDMGFGMRR